MDYLLNLAENTSWRVNLLYACGIYSFSYAYSYSFLAGSGALTFIYYFLLQVIWFGLFALAGIAAFGGSMYLWSWRSSETTESVDWTKYISTTDPEIQKYMGKKIPMEVFITSFLKGKSDFKEDLHETLKNHRNEIFRWVLTEGHLNFFYKKFLTQTFGHTVKEDAVDVQGTYNLGNDFYNAFLGPSMVYTCAVFNDKDFNTKETLEEAQRNKIDLVCKKIALKKGEKHLDIGCGWGTFVRHAAENYGSDSLGITIAKEQIEWGNKQLDLLPNEVRSRAKVQLMDYRDIPTSSRYNKITCLEMAEHVGVKNFQKFCRQLFGILEDDGLLYIQMAGLRPAWQFEDLVWGLFMAKYIFPGADASVPPGWTCYQLETAGFEIHSVEIVTYHYAMTIKRWYDTWIKNKDKIVSAYGESAWRLYYLFLGWSVIIAMQGTSGCYQIVAHKNKNDFDRGQFVGNIGVPSKFTGESKPITQIPPNAFSK